MFKRTSLGGMVWRVGLRKKKKIRFVDGANRRFWARIDRAYRDFRRRKYTPGLRSADDTDRIPAYTVWAAAPIIRRTVTGRAVMARTITRTYGTYDSRRIRPRGSRALCGGNNKVVSRRKSSGRACRTLTRAKVWRGRQRPVKLLAVVVYSRETPTITV